MRNFLALPESPPTSASHTGQNLIAIALPLFATYVAVTANVKPIDVAAIAIGITIISFLVLEIFWRKAHLHAEAGLQHEYNICPRRIGFKLLALSVTLAIISTLYWLLPEYGKKLYKPFFDLLAGYAWIFFVLAPVYIAVLDAFLQEPNDLYARIGRRLAGQKATISRGELKNHMLGWAVKAFFLPLMFTFLVQHITGIQKTEGIQQNALSIMFGIDVMIATAGYLMTLRLLGTHIRSADPTAIGWIAALACYPPFNSIIMADYLGYRRLLDPIGIGAESILVEFMVEFMSLLSITIYTLATAAFGIRFSNLTNRGIITGGPYRYIKHPAYVAKNAFWWFEVVTRLPEGLPSAIRAILMMAGVSAIYWVRAKTEEWHLANDPAYIEYCRWIDENGLLARLRGRSNNNG